MQNKSVYSKSNMVKKTSVIMGVLIAFFGVVVLRLGYWGIVRGNEMTAMAENQHLRTLNVEADRGYIYDCNGNKLVESGTVWDVGIYPNLIDIDHDKSTDDEKVKDGTDSEAKRIAQIISDALGMSYDEVYKKTQEKSGYTYVKKKVDKEQADKISKAILADEDLINLVGINKSSKRYYPEGTLASTVLGFVGDDNQGLSGLEIEYDNILRGVPGKSVMLVNQKESDMPFNYETMIEAEQGKSLTLTIDKNVQYIVEKYLDEAVITNKASNRACCIVSNVNTGEILAMATKPDFDPNEPMKICDSSKLEQLKNVSGDELAALNKKLLEEQWKNKAITELYEPGSVFKIITGSAALEENKINMNSTFECPGYIVISGVRYNCTGTHGHQSLTNIFENSCNPAFIEIGQRLGVDLFYKYFKSYGFTGKTGIDLPGETEGLYYTDKNMGTVELASESFGQTFKITPIQLITAISAACNGGHYMKPHLVKEITDCDNNVIERVEPQEIRQVISADTSAMLCEMLRSVVDNGTGSNAYVAGYRMCGKTGTSQKVDTKDANGDISKYVASFCGFAPADNPQYAILVMIDEPNGDSYYGGAIAAPVAKSIMTEILPILGVEAVYTQEESAEINSTIPSVIGKSVSEATSTIEQSGYNIRVIGEGATVQKQVPAGGVQSPKNCTVVVYTESDSSDLVEVPDFCDLSYSEVMERASEYGINIYATGTAEISDESVAYKQSISPGQKIENGTIITVYFKLKNSVD